MSLLHGVGVSFTVFSDFRGAEKRLELALELTLPTGRYTHQRRAASFNSVLL